MNFIIWGKKELNFVTWTFYRLQEERAAVALSAFLNRSNSMDNMVDLQMYALNGMDISRFTLLQVKFNFLTTCIAKEALEVF